MAICLVLDYLHRLQASIAVMREYQQVGVQATIEDDWETHWETRVGLDGAKDLKGSVTHIIKDAPLASDHPLQVRSASPSARSAYSPVLS